MNNNILKILQDRYFLKDETEWKHIAKRIAGIYPSIYEYIRSMTFIPSTPTLMNCNTNGERFGTLSSCFPMGGPDDSIDSIFESIKECAQVTKMGGGVGYDFSGLRSTKEGIKGLGGRNSSGPLPFIDIFNSTLDGVQQGGCFIGDTLIATPYGPKKIKDIEDGDLVYTYSNKMTIGKAKAAWVTKRNANVWKLDTDKNLSTHGTPDHQFMLRNDKKYRQLSKLTPGTRLMPLTRYIKGGEWFITLHDGKDTRMPEHRWIMQELGYDINNKHVHHKDGNHLNNSLDNLCIMSSKEHIKLHNLDKIENGSHPFLNLTSESIKKRTTDFSKTWKELDDTKKQEWKRKNSDALKIENKKRIKLGTHNWIDTHPNNDPVISAKAKKTRIANSIWRVINEGFEVNKSNWEIVKLQSSLYCTQAFKLSTIETTFGSFDNAIKYINDNNHSVIQCGYSHKEDVWDIEVPGTHNFIICNDDMTSGVVVHNSRRGAGMSMMDITHPDILQFIDAKLDLNVRNRFNFSVKMPNSFYYNLKTNPDSIHMVWHKSTEEWLPLTDTAGKEWTIKELWDKILDNSWKMAEPGIFNKDIAYERCSVNNLSDIILSNPCAEFVNIPYTSCALGSINLEKMVDNSTFNWKRFEETIVEATRFINNTLDINNYPIEQIKLTTLSVRPIGLGFMGLAHCMFKKGIPYNSNKAKKFVNEMSLYLTLRAMKESVELAKINGAYPEFDFDVFMKANERFFKSNVRDINVEELAKDIKLHGVRNSCFTSIAPTGTISYIANTSSGIEPIFALSYSRRIEQLDGTHDIVFISDPVFEDYLNKYDGPTKTAILNYVTSNMGSCRGCELMPEEDRNIFVVAADLTPSEHLDILEIVGRNTSLSVSKTINLPNTITKDEMGDVFVDAYNRGIIGVTVYRDGCREGILIHDIKKKEGIEEFTERMAPKRPEIIPCDIIRVSYSGEKWIVFVGLYDNKPYEIFAGKVDGVNIPKSIESGIIRKNKSRHYSFIYDDEVVIDNISHTFFNQKHDAFARSISMGLRHGTPVQYVVDTLNKAEGDITDFSKVLARTLKKYITDGTGSTIRCECGKPMRYTDGCIQCIECGMSKCG